MLRREQLRTQGSAESASAALDLPPFLTLARILNNWCFDVWEGNKIKERTFFSV